MSEFQRPKDAFRFAFGGVNTRDVADALPPNKYPAVKNMRSTGATSMRTRPGYVPLFSTGNNNLVGAITDIRGYSAIETDALPRFLARDDTGRIWLDNGLLAGAMADSGNQYGASMLPFRPTESPQTWMYIGTIDDYQKFSAPSNTNVVTMQKVGIAEPQQEVQACPKPIYFTDFTNVANNWNNSGSAGSLSDGNRSTDTALFVISDPVLSTRQYIQVGNNANAVYDIGELVSFNNNTTVEVADVIPAVAGNLVIQAIRYQAGNNGNCVIVPSQMPFGADERIEAIAHLRRGSLLKLGGNETVLVHETVTGPNGALAFITNTNNTWAANDTIQGLLAIAVDSSTTFSANQSIVSAQISSNLTVGLGYISQALSPNPFTTAMGSSGLFPQQDDYIHVSLKVDDPTQLTQVMILFNLDAGNFNDNVLYYTVRQSDFVNILGANQTVLQAIQQAAENQIISGLAPAGQGVPVEGQTGNNQWLEVIFPISSLTRLGGDQTRTLSDCNGIQLQTNSNNNITISFGSIWVGGGSGPDVGNNGASYRYRAVPLASETGVRGNPTAFTRYGVNPRRQPVLVQTSGLNSSYDPQIDTWEVYREGGSITSERFIGTVPIGSDFTDTYFDDATAGGTEIEIDNTEPWPSIDMPWKVTSGNATITATGQQLTVTIGNNNFPSTISRWLPGTLFQIGGGEAYTLRFRPTAQGNNTYLFDFEEAIGSGNQSQVFVLEPNVARQTLPYLWGPNEEGYIFGCGDPLRPGVVSWSKAYRPDSTSTPHTLELCPSSEPLLGGEITHGVSLVASSKRWWYLYFRPGLNGEQDAYQPVEAAVGKRLAAPFGKCTDGVLIYFWATDGICATDGSTAKSLTDDDLYNLFPHGGLAGSDQTRAGVTFYAPDYSQVAGFRLAVREGILYATYQDSSRQFRMLVCQLNNMAWSQDVYPVSVTVPYAIEQPSGALETPPSLYPAVIMGDTDGKVWKLKDFVNDNGQGIPWLVATPEWNGGDLRTSELWGDQFIDCVAPYGASVQPYSGGNSIPGVSPTALSANTTRQLQPVSMGGGVLEDFVGLVISGTDLFGHLNVHSRLYAWQPSFADQVETTADRASDWTNCGTLGNKFFQGIILDADTFGENKTLVIQDSDTGSSHVLQPAPILHSGRQTLPYSFETPFLAHAVRDVPDSVPWRKFAIEYVFEPTPEAVETWETQWSAIGGEGYMHIPRLQGSYSSVAPVTLSILSYDGTSPASITLPSTGGATQNPLLTLTMNKGTLYKFSATSPGKFQIFLEDWILYVGQWNRIGTYSPYRNLGGAFGDKARI